MQRIAIAVALAMASMFAVVELAAPANASPAPPWIYFRTYPDPAGCNSAVYYWKSIGTIEDYICDEVQPPSWDAGGIVNLYVIY
jgi:hypothetical protein